MQRRASYRRTRRTRKTRYRQPRFDNRTRPEGWLPPSLKSKAESTVRAVRAIAKMLSVTKVRVEICKFDTQKLQNPEISGEEYQRGKLYQFHNIRNYVFVRDSHTCKICKKQGGILETHHIISKSKGGSDRPDNLVTLHEQCHKDFHAGLVQKAFKKPKQYREASQVTVLKNHIIKELRKTFDVEVTFGNITKVDRKRLQLEKTHFNDAIAIAMGDTYSSANQPERFYLRFCRPRGNYRLYRGNNSQTKNQSPKELFGFKRFDIMGYKKEKYVLKGKRSSGYFCLSDQNNKTIHPSIHHSKLRLINRNNIMEVKGTIPPIWEFL